MADAPPRSSQSLETRRGTSAATSGQGRQGDNPWVPVKGATPPSHNVTSRVNDRLQERSQAESRRRWATMGRRALYVALAVAALWLVLLSPALALDMTKVQVSGYGTVVDERDVTSVLSDYEGTSLALVNPGQVALELAEVSGVRTAEVVRVWPDGLTVELTSREPVAAIPDGDGGYVWVDDEAVEVGAGESAPTDIPVIDVPRGDENARILSAVLTVVRELPTSLRDRVEGIRAETEDSVTFTLRDGPQVEWGSAEQSALKAEVLGVLLDSPDALAADVIDVSAPTLPITRTAE